jgi:hypothetical protein
MSGIKGPSTRTESEPQALLAEIANDEWGQVSASIYDTARVAALAPWLSAHATRLEFICKQQGSDGSWGEPDGYALVPTLSATEALLTTLRRMTPDGGPVDGTELALAADRGLNVLGRWLAPDADREVPDTIAVELVVPTLVDEINTHLDKLSAQPATGIDGYWSNARLAMPRGIDATLVDAVRGRLVSGHPLPEKLWASLEAFGSAGTGASFVRPAGGAVAGSPAATAAWLGAAPSGEDESVRYLEGLQARGGGLVPGVTPITFFEPSWVLNSLATAGLAYHVRPAMLDRLDLALTEYGAPAAPGLPPDSDDTAGVLCALARHGRVRRPDSLMHYRTSGYFTCFPDERTPSISTNAHVLEALAGYLEHAPWHAARFAAPVDMVARWLLDNQRADGSWLDKWHASPYYATARCAVALARHDAARSRPALARAAAWVLATQRADGSWGRWRGTIEETAYAVQILACTDPRDRTAAMRHAAIAGCGYLRTRNQPADYPGLWHAKDLYAPIAVIRAARLAALALGARLLASPGADLPAGPAAGRPTDLDARPADLDARPADLGARPADLDARPADLGARPADLGARQADLGARPADLGSRPPAPACADSR